MLSSLTDTGYLSGLGDKTVMLENQSYVRSFGYELVTDLERRIEQEQLYVEQRIHAATT